MPAPEERTEHYESIDFDIVPPNKQMNAALQWQSRLQTDTALSTMEAVANTLAACMRELIPIIDMVNESTQSVGLQAGDVNMNVSVHEDNLGALVLAETLPPQFTPRSKYYATKTIWFREEIHKRGIQLKKIETSEKLGDVFTKGLTQATFEYLRVKIVEEIVSFL
jgi:hypothetical protein